MNNKVFDTISKYNMLNKGDTVAVCLSGGADSMSLFHFLCQNAQTLGIDVFAIHINHGLRAESEQEEKIVKEYCERLGKECYIKRLDMNNCVKPQGKSVEDWARDLRYEYFYEISDKTGAKLALAHTLSDMCETVLFNITRGASVKGAGGIPPVRDRIIRPLIDCTREEIEQYCKANDIEYVTDKTNFEDIYSRNKIRLHVMPILNLINQSAQHSIGDFARENREIYSFLSHLSDKLHDNCNTSNGLCCEKMLNRDKVVVKVLIRNQLDKIGCLSKNNVDNIYLNLSKNSYVLQLSKDYFAVIKNGYLNFERTYKKSTSLGQIPVKTDDLIDFGDYDFYFSLVERGKCENQTDTDKNCLYYMVDYGKIKNNIFLRTRKSGDIFTLPKRNVTKSLKKLFIEDKIEQHKRDTIPLIADDTGNVVWIYGYGVNKKYVVDSKTTDILVIKVNNKSEG